MKGTTYERVIGAARDVLPTTIKTCVWLVKITVLISFGILILRYFNILPWFSGLISPVFNIFGLPGEAALAYVTGYFVNVYSAIAVISTLDL
ncbi:MAG: nucleoside recognition protein, partial [Bacteroidia bacterium]|nr:nucleoside recognition protein [Bacteroidia bacterium]